MDTDPLAPPADSRSVGRDLHSVLFPQKSYLAVSVLPSGVLPNDLPASVTKSDKAAGSAGRARDLERFEDLARNQMALISLIDSLQTLLFKVLFDTSSETQSLEFRDSSPSEAATVLAFLASTFGHLSASNARLYSRIILARRDSVIGDIKPDIAAALRSAPLDTSGLFGRAAEAARAKVDSENSSLAMANMAKLATKWQESKTHFTIPRVATRGRGQQVQRQQVASPYGTRGRGSSRGRGRGRGRGSATVTSQSQTKKQNPQ